MVKKTKTIKAWAVVLKKANRLENDAYFNGGDCCCSGEPQALSVYESKKIAEECIAHHDNYMVVKVEISYKLPSK